MPYEIRHDGGDDKPYCVYNKNTGKREGCSATRALAQAHMRALYAAEKKEAMDIINILKDAFTELITKIGNIGGDKPRGELEDSDFVFADERKFPVVTGEDVSDAVSSWGRYKGKHTFEEFKSRLIALCRRKGLVKFLPDTWEIKEVDEANTYERSLVQFKQADGSWRWVTVSSTAFIDRDVEIVSRQSLEKAVAMNKEDLGYLTYWHVPTIKLGKCDAQFVDGVCLVETGTWFSTDVAEAFRKDVADNPSKYGVSIEFLARLDTAEKDVEVNGIIVKTVWNDIELGDRSLLPAQRASNIFARIDAQGGFAGMKEEKLAFLRQVVGEELAAKVAGTVDMLNEYAATDDAVTKDASEVPVEETIKAEDSITEPVVSAPVPAEETVIDMVSPLDKLRLFAATLDEAKQTEIAPIIIALDEVINKPEPEPEPEDETPVDSTDYDSTANDETAKETGQPEPQETEKEADAQPPVAQEPSPEVVAALAEVQELKEKLSQLIDSINEYFEEQKRKEQEEVPNLVLSRVTQDSSNVITSREEVKAIKAQNNDDGAVHSMAAAILKTLGGTQ